MYLGFLAGLALFTAISAAIFVALIWRYARHLEREGYAREQAERAKALALAKGYAPGPVFEDIALRFNDLVSRVAEPDGEGRDSGARSHQRQPHRRIPDRGRRPQAGPRVSRCRPTARARPGRDHQRGVAGIVAVAALNALWGGM